MMLQALIAYAERETLGDADFEAVGVRWLIPLDLNGHLAGGPIPLCEDPGEKKPRPRQLTRPFTSPNDLNQGTKSHFLCDTLERVALFLDAKAPEKEAGRRVQHSYFKVLLQEAAMASPNDAVTLRSTVAFLESKSEREELHRQLTTAKAKPTDNAVFAVDGVQLLESETIKAFWRARRRSAGSASPAREPRVCIATGEFTDTLNTTDKIKGVPGGLAVGTNLISFDKDSFCSFGLDQAQNAALSAPAELKIRSALNALIAKSREQRLVFNDTVHLHWTRKPIESDPMDLLAGGDEKAIASLLRSVHEGQEILGIEPDAYYAMSLSGNGARIVVRDWLESTVPEVRRNIADWFTDLATIQPDGSHPKNDFKFGALLYAMVRAEVEEISPQIPTQLLYGALRGRSVPLPQSALAAAIRRQQIEPTSTEPLRRGVIIARMALIRACLRRSPTNSSASSNPNRTMTEALNPESADAAYLCGRLFAVFDRLQYLALGGVNAGVVERYYASASVTPSLVMGRLFRNAQFHLAKAENGIAENVRKDFESLACALGNQFPPTLDLEAQGRFALGYYHQKADYRRRTAERKEAAAAAATT